MQHAAAGRLLLAVTTAAWVYITVLLLITVRTGVSTAVVLNPGLYCVFDSDLHACCPAVHSLS